MASLIKELTETLTEQNNIYQSLLEIASKKKVAIIENNISNLQEFLKEENILVGRNQRLDKKRIDIFKDISVVLGKNENLSLKDIIDIMKGQEGEKELTEIREKLLEVLPKLKALNDQNQELIKISMDYVDFSMNIIRAGGNVPTYYDSLGNEINVSDKKMFDAKQ
ncbi:flagellar protein FlgN [uncultured Tyzzerella sp.]|uniref:flagellar protein FlgN n=1 Tax=uncultured Tyzzerella sp. TaxID=2321398 RepID=UPI002943F0F4|nr:flagellar protein FlgN [uncultured Tyzzerella sp.]